jgi:hypothetical protein
VTRAPLRTDLLEGRAFQCWHFIVSHGMLLIRSPRDAGHATNVDLICVDVLHMDVPRFLGRIAIVDATPSELASVVGKCGAGRFGDVRVLALETEFARALIGCASWVIEENTLELMESPLDGGPVGRRLTARTPDGVQSADLDPSYWLRELLAILERLAGTADQQAAYLTQLGVAPSADELGLELDDALPFVIDRLPPALRDAISALEDLLRLVPKDEWTAAALRTSARWDAVRVGAGKAIRELERHVRDLTA